MQIAVQQRLLALAGLIVLSLVLLAAGAQIGQAIVVSGYGGGGSASSFTSQFKDLTAARVAQQHSVAVVADTSQVGMQGTGVVSDTAASGKITVPTSASSPSGTSSTAWIIAGSVLAAVAVVAVAMALARRRRPTEAAAPGSAAFCSLHPDDALCGAA